MNELDFDELDKAVNSLMSGMDTTKRNTALDDPVDNVIALTPSAPADTPSTDPAAVSTPEVATPEIAPVDTPAGAPRPAQPLAVKRRGKFMDMIHPSSDMKTTTPVPKREGVSLQPSSPFVPPALSQLGATEATPGTEMKSEPQAPVVDVVTPAQPESESSAEPVEAPKKSEWPDPIDMAPTAPSVSDEPSAESAPAVTETTEVPAEVLNEVAKPAGDEPLSSPFLPDAKVEKRPLGGGAADLSVGMSEVEATETPATVAPAEPIAPVQLPEELKTDVMALESTSTKADDAAPVETETAPVFPGVETEPPKEEAVKKDTPQAGGGSIPQQYAEQPSTGDRSNAPIYDTSTHQPLSAPTKKASPLKWIILMLVLLIVGAIGGAAYFYFSQHMG